MRDKKGNTGYKNTGSQNIGSQNTGDLNTGIKNTGSMNTGHSNTGYFCTGDWNTGFFCTGDWNTGFFCTKTPKATLFDLPSDWTQDEVRKHLPYFEFPFGCEWVESKKMTDEEKADNPTHTTTGGFLRVLETRIQDAFPKWWANASLEDRTKFLTLPNFNADKFKECTGVDVREWATPDIPAKSTVTIKLATGETIQIEGEVVAPAEGEQSDDDNKPRPR